MFAAENVVERLRAQAAKCRVFADQASDPEVAQALRNIAKQIDLALPILPSDEQPE